MDFFNKLDLFGIKRREKKRIAKIKFEQSKIDNKERYEHLIKLLSSLNESIKAAVSSGDVDRADILRLERTNIMHEADGLKRII